MSYVFDNSPLSTLLRNYYRKRFPSLWERFDDLIANGSVVSTREVFRELENAPEEIRAWAVEHRELFATPTAAEGAFVARIFAVEHFQQNLEQQKLLRGGNNADPFVIEGRTVVTMEVMKPHAAKIPSICKHFGIACFSLEEFMEAEDWRF